MRTDNTKEKGNALNGLIGGTLSLTISAIIVKFIGLIYKIPIASLLGDQGMGYFNSAYTVYAFFYLFCTAGVPKAIMILISEAKTRGKIAEEGKIMRVAIALFLSIGILLTLILIIFSVPIAELIGNNKSYFAMIGIAPSILLVAVGGVIRGYLSANTRLLDIGVSQIIEGVGKLGLGLVFAIVGGRMNLPIEILSALTISGVTFGSLLGLIYLIACSKMKIKKEKTEQTTFLSNNRQIIKRILSISIPITLSAAIMSITNLIDLGLIMRSLLKIGYSEASANALYGNYTTLAVPMFNLALSVISPISIAFLPVFTRYSISSDKERLIGAERSAIELTSLICAPMMVGLIMYSKEILDMLFSSSDTRTGAILLSLISPAIFFSSLLLILNTLLEAFGRVKAPLLSMSIGSLVKVLTSYLLITKTDMGILGAPIGTVLSYATALVVSMLIYSSEFGRHIPIFEASFLPYINAFSSVLLSRIVYQKMLLFIDNLSICLMLSILLAALIYIGISAFSGVLAPKKIGEIAKYTNLS